MNTDKADKSLKLKDYLKAYFPQKYSGSESTGPRLKQVGMCMWLEAESCFPQLCHILGELGSAGWESVQVRLKPPAGAGK